MKKKPSRSAELPREDRGAHLDTAYLRASFAVRQLDLTQRLLDDAVELHQDLNGDDLGALSDWLGEIRRALEPILLYEAE